MHILWTRSCELTYTSEEVSGAFTSKLPKFSIQNKSSERSWNKIGFWGMYILYYVLMAPTI